MKTFVSYDGIDANGVRAEVYVQDGKGTVKEIKENKNGTADVHFQVENLKYPVHGWIGQDNPVYDVVKKSLETKEEVNFRIEVQRKSSVERSIPISDLRTDMNKARENTISILAAINGISSDEAVTSPSEDPASTYGRIKATGSEKKAPAVGVSNVLSVLQEVAASQTVTSDIIAGIAAQAILNGAGVDDVLAAISGPDRKDDSQPELKKSFSVEAPSWKSYNSDGRQNLGSSSIQAGVGAEQFVRGNIVKNLSLENYDNTDLNNAVDFFAKAILAISDKIQAAVYGKGFRADRSVASHARVRGIVYDTINEYYPIPVNKDFKLSEEELNNWVTLVGKLSFNRFKLAIEVSNHTTSIDEITLPDSLKTGSTMPEKATVLPEEVAVKEEPQASIAEETTPVIVETEDVNDAVSSAEVDYEVLPPSFIEESILVSGKLPDELAPTEDTIELFKEFVSDSGLDKKDIAKVSKFLAWTYGPRFTKAQMIPDDVLTEFVDFYVSLGSDNFVKAVTGTIK
jgi:hypothetical protein